MDQQELERRRRIARRRKIQRIRKIREMRRRRRIRKLCILFSCFLLLLVSIIGIGCMIFSTIHKHNEKKAQEALAQQQQEYQAQLEAKERQRIENTVRITAVGDNLIHEKIYKSGINDDGSYTYDHLYKNIKNEIQSSDISIVNQETIFVEDHDDVSAYPSFGSPTEIGDYLVKTGFDVVQHASNHTFDKGTSAIKDTLYYWKNNHPDIKVLGIHETQKAADTISTIKSKGITFALLNYTDISNKDTDDCPSYMIDQLSLKRLEKDIKKAEKISDVIIALIHIGTEYSTEPSEEQLNYLDALLTAGVDITICAHPHVLQPYEMMSDDEGNEMLVYYSLGNFISTQKDPICLLGGMADISVYRDPITGKISITDYGMIPLVTHYNYDKNDYTVYKLEDYTEKLAKQHSIHEETDDIFTLAWLREKYHSILSQTYD